MLDVHAKILGDIKYSGVLGRAISGRDAIDAMTKSFKDADCYTLYTELATKDDMQAEIEQFISFWKGSIGHYFRNLYWIMKMIDTSVDMLAEDKAEDVISSSKRRFYTDYIRKRNYANIVRAQLSESEMALLQINCLSTAGADLKYYVEKYSLLKPLGESYFDAWAEYMSSKFNRMAFVGLEHINVDVLMKMRVDKIARGTSFIRKNS